MINAHSRFARMHDAFLRAFGEPVSFNLSGGAVTLQAVVRSASDVMNAPAGGNGVLGDEAVLAVSLAAAAQLSEGVTFTHSGRIWRIAGPADRDGRAMAIFPIEIAPS